MSRKKTVLSKDIFFCLPVYLGAGAWTVVLKYSIDDNGPENEFSLGLFYDKLDADRVATRILDKSYKSILAENISDKKTNLVKNQQWSLI